MLSKVWDEITYPFSNFKGATGEVWEWINKIHPTSYKGCNYLCMLGLIDNCMYSSDELFQRSRERYSAGYFIRCEAAREMNTKITPEWAQEQFVTRVLT